MDDKEYDMAEIAFDAGVSYELVNNLCCICDEQLGFDWEKTKKIVRRCVTYDS